MSGNGSGLKVFFGCVAVLFLLRLGLAFALFPTGVAYALSILTTFAFIAIPVFGLYKAAQHDWKSPLALTLFFSGLVVHLGLGFVGKAIPEGEPILALLSALAQAGLLVWSLGLGAILGGSLKDKNLLIPVAIFLVGFDMFLVFSPGMIPARLMRESPQLTEVLLADVPAPMSEETVKAGIETLAYIGPADFIFTAAFFVAMVRFGMRARRSVQWLIPVLGLFLLAVVFFGKVQIGPLSLGMLPAMVPIGLTILLINWKEFKLTGQEAAAIVVVTLVSIALGTLGIWNANKPGGGLELQVEPLTQENVQELPAPAGSP